MRHMTDLKRKREIREMIYESHKKRILDPLEKMIVMNGRALVALLNPDASDEKCRRFTNLPLMEFQRRVHEMDLAVQLVDVFDKPTFYHVRQAIDDDGNVAFNLLDESVLPKYNELGVNLIRESSKRNSSMGRKDQPGVRYRIPESTASASDPQICPEAESTAPDTDTAASTADSPVFDAA